MKSNLGFGFTALSLISWLIHSTALTESKLVALAQAGPWVNFSTTDSMHGRLRFLFSIFSQVRYLSFSSFNKNFKPLVHYSQVMIE